MIIVDVEIKKAILGRNEQPLPGIEYCEGWRDFAGMGISCVCTYDIVTHLSRAFFEQELGDLAVYLYGKQTAGFNTKRFDLPLLREHGVDVDFGPSAQGAHYDMREQIWLALGLNPDKFNSRTHGGWGLDAVADATLGIRKTGNGALAPVWWQQGFRGKVIDSCLNDVWMEGQMLLHIIKHGCVVVPEAKRAEYGGELLPVRRPDGVRYVYAADPITGPQDNLQDVRRMASAGEPLIDLDKPRATGSGEAGPSVSPGGLGIIR